MTAPTLSSRIEAALKKRVWPVWLDAEKFYDLAQVYRLSPITTVAGAYDQLRFYIRDQRDAEDARTKALVSAMTELIHSAIAIKDGYVVNCAYDCLLEGAHPSCRACSALARVTQALEQMEGE